MTKNKENNNSIPRRRFGRTEIQIPVLSLGGMRFQQSWKDLDPKEIQNQQQAILQKTIHYACENGMHHIETARHYGTSELQIGWALGQIDDPRRILQTIPLSMLHIIDNKLTEPSKTINNLFEFFLAIISKNKYEINNTGNSLNERYSTSAIFV